MKAKDRNTTIRRIVAYVFLGVLFLYPLRHISTGVDLMDAGYNYANFRYPGTEHMDPMWYFATWTATAVGSFLGRLPFGDCMLGMNFYTGLFVSLLATAGFLFCHKILKLPAWIAFLCEITACNLCWLPTAVLYNYLTFVFFLFACIFLYLGLVREREGLLAAAGVCLGLNVGVRFSNLVQAGLILLVWCYAFWTKKKSGEWIRWTLACVAGYLLALVPFLGGMGLCYGPTYYVSQISRLFTMTQVARDYTPLNMLAGLPAAFLGCSYWIKRFGLVLVLCTGSLVILPKKFPRVRRGIVWAVLAGFYVWLLQHRFSYRDFASYTSIYDPCILLLLFFVAVSFYIIIQKATESRHRLLALLELLIILLTSLGGNNGAYYCINNLFLILPLGVTLTDLLRVRYGGTVMYAFRAMLTLLAVLVCLLGFGFGSTFYYEEATGGRDSSGVVMGIGRLRNMKTSQDKAQALTGLSKYLKEQGLGAQKCILYGQIPGLAYYLELEPAMNIWSDLDSYTPEVMRQDLEDIAGAMAEGGEEPLVILAADWAEYLRTGEEPEKLLGAMVLQKADFLKEFLKQQGYRPTFSNKMFVVYEKIHL